VVVGHKNQTVVRPNNPVTVAFALVVLVVYWKKYPPNQRNANEGLLAAEEGAWQAARNLPFFLESTPI